MQSPNYGGPPGGMQRGMAPIQSPLLLIFLAFVRIALGAKLLLEGAYRLTTIGNTHNFKYLISEWTTGEKPMAVNWYGYFLQHVISNHTDFWTIGVALAQIIIGLMLFVGFVTPFFGFLSAILSTHFLLATWNFNADYLGFLKPAQALHEAYLVLALICIFGHAGRMLSVDALIARFRPQGNFL